MPIRPIYDEIPIDVQVQPAVPVRIEPLITIEIPIQVGVAPLVQNTVALASTILIAVGAVSIAVYAMLPTPINVASGPFMVTVDALNEARRPNQPFIRRNAITSLNRLGVIVVVAPSVHPAG